MLTPLLSTKFNLPAAGALLTPRARLSRLLDEGLSWSATVTLVCAPAGYGKTTAVSAWLQASSLPPDQFTWLTLETSDNVYTRFLTYLIAAVQRIQPGFGRGLLKLLQTHKPASQHVLATLLVNELNEIPARFVIVLDDFHLLTDESIIKFIAFLVEHQPPHLNLVLITRADPPLSLPRLRARRQLIELRQADLRFTVSESAEFLSQIMAVDLDSAHQSLLTARTEGWIAGLQLAGLSLRHHGARAKFIEAFSGEHEFVADYLTTEVLDQLPADLRRFMLETSILDRLCAPLCNAVTGQTAAQTHLNQMLEANLFLLQLDTTHTWYRYHNLFADLLQKRLHAESTTPIAELHRRASLWYQQNNLVDPAIRHALAAEDHPTAADLLEQIAELFLMRGEATTLLNWLDALPTDLLLLHPRLATFKGFALFLCSRSPQEALTLLETIQSAARSTEFSGETTALHALLAVLQGQAADAVQLGARALEQLPAERLFFRCLAADSLGMGHTLAGNSAAAIQAFEQVVSLATQSDNLMMVLAALTNLAGLQYMQGHLRAAIAASRQVLELADQRIGSQSPLVGKTLLNLGEMLREQGDLEAATQHLQDSARLMQFFSEIGSSLVWLSLARIKIYQRDWQAAQAHIDQARALAQATQSTPIDDRLVEVMQMRYWLARRDLAPVREWAARRGLLDHTPAEVFEQVRRNAMVYELLQGEALTLVRLYLAQSQPDQALDWLTYLYAQVVQRGNRRRLLEILVLQALTFHQKGALAQALQTLSQAFALAEPEGYARTFVDEGEPMAALLYQAVAHNLNPAFASHLLNALLPSEEPVKPPPNSDLVETLSQRELEVLGAIASGLSNPEIAGKLHISLSTVKGHTANIFGKLTVKNRTQAVARARALGLLPA